MRILLLLFICFSGSIVAKTLPATNFQATHDFINKMVKNHQFNKDELLFIFSKIELTLANKNQKKRKPKKEKTISWDKYKGLFITEQRIRDGINFWQDNLTTLKRAERKYKVPVEIIVAVLGIETNYGNKKGTNPTLETLAKRAFGNYRRKKFYQKELKEFLLMSRENAIPPLSIQGSYAGAMGYPQFIASSYRHYAVDFNHDGKIDLFSNPIDAIGSIAHYFDKHQWHDGGEFARPITLKTRHLKHARLSTNKPKKNARYWRNKGLEIHQNIKNKTKLAFISLPQDEVNETWLTFWNFYVLTRYNHDNRYAMAVYQLSSKLKQAFNQPSN